MSASTRRLLLLLPLALTASMLGCQTDSALPRLKPNPSDDMILSALPPTTDIQWGQADSGLQLGLSIGPVNARGERELIGHLKNTGSTPFYLWKPSEYWGEEHESPLEFKVNGRTYRGANGGLFVSFPPAPTAEAVVKLEPGQSTEGHLLFGMKDWRDVAQFDQSEPAPPWEVEITFVYTNRWADLTLPVGHYGLWDHNHEEGPYQLNMFARLAPMWTGEARSGSVRARFDRAGNRSSGPTTKAAASNPQLNPPRTLARETSAR